MHYMTGKELVLKAVFDKAFHLMDHSLNEKLSVDETYLIDERDTTELCAKYEALPLELSYKLVIDDYHACNFSKLSRMIELAYQAGIETTLQIIKDQVA